VSRHTQRVRHEYKKLRKQSMAWSKHLNTVIACFTDRILRRPHVYSNRLPKAALTGRSGCDAQLWHFHEEIPGQQLIDFIDGMIGDALEDVTEVAFGVEIVEFCGAE
jgi:hypothetical protein